MKKRDRQLTTLILVCLWGQIATVNAQDAESLPPKNCAVHPSPFCPPGEANTDDTLRPCGNINR